MDEENTIKAKAGYGVIQIKAEPDLAKALIGIVSYLASDGTVSVLTCPRKDNKWWLIEFHANHPARKTNESDMA